MMDEARDAARLRELQSMALRMAAAAGDRETRQKLLAIAEDLAAQAEAMESADRELNDEPPLPAT